MRGQDKVTETARSIPSYPTRYAEYLSGYSRGYNQVTSIIEAQEASSVKVAVQRGAAIHDRLVRQPSYRIDVEQKEAV